jgi:hypothetical protein
MTPATEPTIVPPEEVARRIAEMRRLAYKGKSPPMVVYHPPDQPCPWPGCGYRISGIAFQLERMVSPEQMDSYLASWWLGPGLVGRCPHCRQLVLFDVLHKEAVSEDANLHVPRLPDDWHERAHVSVASQR